LTANSEFRDTDVAAQGICLSENLELHEYVGGGSFKGVYRITTRTGEICALKVNKAAGVSPRTIREVDAIRRCRHVSVARLLHSGTHEIDGQLFHFTLEEFLDGGTLTSRLQQGALTTNLTVEYGRLLIDALVHIAGLGLVHRDIKPENIMFRATGDVPVIVDFGLVRDLSASSLTQTWLVRGPATPYFAAPEQLNNQKRMIDWRCDQFSLGVTLCYCHFGMHPFQMDGEPIFAVDTVDRVASRGPRNSALLRSCAREGMKCIERMTRVWPVERYRDPTDLATQWPSGRSA
jgi:serine/threonine protein kinase